MQPTFFPWAGYFNLISSADRFVFLDDVQLEKQSWQTRNRILLHGNPSWITVPVVHQKLEQTIGGVEVSDRHNWRSKLMRTLSQGYARHPHRGEILEVAGIVESLETSLLADINMAIIQAISEKLGIRTSFSRSSELKLGGERSDRLIGICEHFECENYLSSVGSSEYLAEDHFAEKTSIHLKFQKYDPVPYSQPKAEEFVSHLSILDVVACLGWENASQYVRGEYEE